MNKSRCLWPEVMEHLQHALGRGVYLTGHYGRQVLMIGGLPNEVTIYIEDPSIGEGYTARLSHDGPDRYYGACRHFTTIHSLTLWLKRKIARETELVAEFKRANPNWRRCV